MIIDEVCELIIEKLNELRPAFIPEAELTFIMRVPGDPNCYMIVTNDDLRALNELLTKETEGE